MKLYYSPGACSLSPHIALREAGIEPELVQVDLKAKKLADGGDFTAINPKGQVPALRMEDGSVLTEGPAIVQWIADHKPEAGLAPPAGTMERYRLMELLNFISTEIHKGFSPLFKPNTPAEYRTIAIENLGRQFDRVSAMMDGREYLLGDRFSVADGYLFTVTNWAKPMNVDLSGYPNLTAWRERVAARPAVQEALKAESPQKS